MAEVWTMGEILVEIMRPEAGIGLDVPGVFKGPYPSGAPAIFIDTIARLGHTAGIIGGVGADDFGTCVTNRLEKDGVDTSQVLRDDAGSTAVAFVTYFEDGSRRFIYHIDGTPAAKACFSKDISIDQSTKFFHMMGCSLMVNETFQKEIIAAAEHMASRGVKLSIDPNIRPELLKTRTIHDVLGPVLNNCSVLMPGLSELKLLSGTDDVRGGIDALFEQKPFELIVLKKGSEGAVIYSREEEITVPVYKVEEVDATGAGDCFDAGFLCGILEGLSLEECGKLAAAAGALNAAAFGPMEGAISRTAVEKLMKS
jgi:sugar/nucleoside kinase (ribokinase family)